MIPASPTARAAIVELARYETSTATYPLRPTIHAATRASLHAAGYLTSTDDFSCRLTEQGRAAAAELGA